jgi:flagellar biosynthesis protein FlhG
MIPIDKLKTTDLQNARIACAYIFSPQLSKSDEFIKSLNRDSLKKAYRNKVKKYHPDFYRHEEAETLKRRSERFIKIQESYRILSSHFQENVQPISKTGERKIIAIGGAKGGIGKSLFTANLGVSLSNRGMRTVVVDLDLGGANLHLFLGERIINTDINCFLKKRIPSLSDAMIKTKYGPSLIGGNSSQLGSANINFAQKLKLMKAIKNIDADYIIIDLGGNTSYNIIDFFLMSDYRVILTSCDPASYLDAYNFIKTALYRRLYRLFGPESKYNNQKDNNLEYLIQESITSTLESKLIKVEDLLAKVKRYLPESLPILCETISDFSPNLIVNRIPRDFNVNPIVSRIQDVSAKMLSIKINYLGGIPYNSEIELSARNLIPVVSCSTHDVLPKKMDQIIQTLLGK